MVKKVFYIEKVEFLRSMMEFALKAHGAEIYTVDTIENNFYLLDDLEPDLILFDVETAKNQLAELSEYSSRAILVAIGSEDSRSEVMGMVKNYLTKPLEAKNIADRILSLLD
jgi:DNA-binding response OmpR family regulator